MGSLGGNQIEIADIQLGWKRPQLPLPSGVATRLIKLIAEISNG